MMLRKLTLLRLGLFRRQWVYFWETVAGHRVNDNKSGMSW